MRSDETLALAVWKEACRHIEIADCATLLAPLLARRLPVARLRIHRLDVPAGRIVLAASASPLAVDPARENPLVEPDPAAFRRLLAWCRKGEPFAAGRRRRPPRPALPLEPPSADGEWLAGPLAAAEDALGAAVLELKPGAIVRAEHRSAFRMLLEPLAAALHNDARLRELLALREAAEADKRSLLTRLGRESLGEEVVAADGGLRPVFERVSLVAPSDAPVLILGATGSGKEVVARAIHGRSRRASGPFIRVNCGAIPSELIDSELFGHERGAFTGAVGTRRGWFERADGGTLFLDEIGELPAAAQVRLLRILQEGTYERVGGEETLRADVRIVAATHRDLAGMVQAQAFREDLWYRVAVFPIHLPPLRAHPEDIPAFAEHFARRASHRFGLPHIGPSREDLAVLRAYDWPGNIRELAAVIDRAVILGGGHRLEIGLALGGSVPTTAKAASPTPPSFDPITLDAAAARHIQGALRHARGRIEGPTGAAALLGINPHTLRSRMRKLGIDWAAFRPE